MADGPIVAPVEAGTEVLNELADRLQHTDVSTSGSGLTLEQKYELCRSVGFECIQDDELRNLLEKKPNPVAYDGFEPSGRMHIAQGVLKALNVNKLTKSGVTFKFWVADWFAQLNNKMGGDLAKIQTVGKYMVEIWKAVGMDMSRVQFLSASEEINKKPNEYWTLVMDIARLNTLARITKCSQIMGRSETDNLAASQIFYPCMQCADIFYLKADICQLGLDQRKVNVLAREYCDQCKPKRKLKPVILSHEMMPGLLQGQEKMSKSDPNSAIFMEDSAADVKTKIKKAFCEPKMVEGNPCLAYIRLIILPWFGKFEVQRGEAQGGNKTYESMQDVEEDFSNGALHPGDLKPALATALNSILQPVRDHFEKDADAAALLKKVKAGRLLAPRRPLPRLKSCKPLCKTAAESGVQVRQLIQLDCAKIALGGKGVCRDATGLVVFTDALPGEKLVAEVTKIKKGYAEASKVETLQPHANAAAAPCPHFGVCGGCNYQSLKYAAQLQAKQAQVLEAFQHVGGIDLSMCNVLPIVPCQNQYHYRNNMQFAFGTAAISGSTAQRQASSLSSNATSMQETPPEVVQPQEEKAAPEVQQSGKATIAPSQQSEANTQLSHTETRPMFLGLHAMNDPSQIVPIDTCLLQDSDASKLLHAAQDACAKVSQLVAHHFSTPQGFLRQLTIRRNSNSEYLILITSTSCRPHILQPLVKALLATAVNVRGIVNRVVPQPARSTPAKHLGKGKPKHRKVRKHGHATHRQTDQNSSSAATGAVGKPSSHILFGVGEIAEQLCGLEFGISADSFFQVNSRQAEVLYGMVQDAAGLQSTDILLDLFCGTGTIGLSLAHACRRVYGVEVAPSSVADARRNAAHNSISNATFVKADLENMVGMMGRQVPQPDVIVTDPARAGMSVKLIRFLQASGARTIVYVSCNPATQARDIRRLCNEGNAQYKLRQIQACDMFPNTAHIECVAVLERQ